MTIRSTKTLHSRRERWLLLYVRKSRDTNRYANNGTKSYISEKNLGIKKREGSEGKEGLLHNENDKQ